MGRLLSRMVFNIYTAELHQIENSNTMVFQYADDFIILFYNRDFEIAAQNLQTKTLIFKRYCNSLNLSFNPSKSHTMYFAKKKKQHKEINLSINGFTVKQQRKLTFIGRVLTISLTVKDHYEKIGRDIRSRSNML